MKRFMKVVMSVMVLVMLSVSPVYAASHDISCTGEIVNVRADGALLFTSMDQEANTGMTGWINLADVSWPDECHEEVLNLLKSTVTRPVTIVIDSRTPITNGNSFNCFVTLIGDDRSVNQKIEKIVNSAADIPVNHDDFDFDWDHYDPETGMFVPDDAPDNFDWEHYDPETGTFFRNNFQKNGFRTAALL